MSTQDSPSVDRHVGRRLRQRRKQLAHNQSEVAARVGVTFQQVHKYETGQSSASADRLWRLAQALEVPVSYFFEGLGT